MLSTAAAFSDGWRGALARLAGRRPWLVRVLAAVVILAVVAGVTGTRTLVSRWAGPRVIGVGAEGADALAMSPDGRTMYAANWTGDSGGGSGISVLDVATGRVTGQIAADFSVTELVMVPDGRVLYLVNQVGDGSDQLVRLDLATQRAGSVIAFPRGVQGTALAPDGAVLYVLEKTSGSPSAIVPVDTGSGQEGTRVPVPSWSQALTVSPDGRTLYVGTGSANGKGAGEVVPVDARSGKAGSPARFPYGVISIAVASDGRELFGLASSYQCGADGRSECGGECDVVGLDLVTGKVQYTTHVSSGCAEAKIGPGQRQAPRMPAAPRTS
jgi:hypothetical protein